MEEKVFDLPEVARRVAAWRAANPGARLALCHGCFDIVHPGHIRHLNSARENADMLVVSITPDSFVNKGAGRPFVPQALRLDNLAALSAVDMATVAPGETAMEVIEALRPDAYVKGNEYAYSQDPRFLAESRAVQSYGGRVVYTSGDVVFSSSQIIRNYKLDTMEAEKLRFICLRYGITRQGIHAILADAQRLRIIVTGEAILNEYNHCEGIGISPASPVLSLSMKRSERMVGGAGLIACHFAAFGADVTFFTSVDAADPLLPEFSDAMRHAGCKMVNVPDPARHVVVKSKFIVDRHKVLEVDNGTHHPLDSKMLQDIAAAFDEALATGPGCVVYSDFGYGMLSEVLLNELVQKSRRTGALIVGDLSTTLRTQIGKFYNADLFLPTELELRSCFHDYESGISVLVDRFYQVTCVKELYMTLNDRSVLYFRKPPFGTHTMETIHVPPLSKACVDKSGVDDAFLAGVVLARAHGADEAHAAYLGAICSASHGERFGCHSICVDDLYHLMDQRPELA